METKQKIIEVLVDCLSVQDSENLVAYLEKQTDFFTAPASTVFHGSVEGGLAEHSWNVYALLKEKVERYGLPVPKRTIALCGLMHDVCKTNFYAKVKKWIVDPEKPVIMKSAPLKKDAAGRVLEWGEQETKNWIYTDAYEVQDIFPAGHGEKSVFILQRILQLTDEEILAIRWHMVIDPSVHFNYPYGYSYNASIAKYPFVTLMQTADMEASQVLETKSLLSRV